MIPILPKICRKLNYQVQSFTSRTNFSDESERFFAQSAFSEGKKIEYSLTSPDI